MRKYAIHTTVAVWTSEDGPDDVFVRVSAVRVEIDAPDKDTAWKKAGAMRKENGWGDITLEPLDK